jgi:hypothetical protein
MGPSVFTEVAEIMSGRAIAHHVQAAICNDVAMSVGTMSRPQMPTGPRKSDRPGSCRGLGKRGQLEEVTPCGARTRRLSRRPPAWIETGLRKRTRVARAPRL